VLVVALATCASAQSFEWTRDFALPGAATTALDWNAYIATHSGSLGVPFSAGQSVGAELYFRDPLGPKTTALSNALTFTVCP
jgi:hypothetical protein